MRENDVVLDDEKLIRLVVTRTCIQSAPQEAGRKAELSTRDLL